MLTFNKSSHLCNLLLGTVVTTFVGGGAGSTGGHVDATGTNAEFNGPAGIAQDSSGNLYVCDAAGVRIRAITPSGTGNYVKYVQINNM